MAIDFAQIDAILASGHADDEHVAMPVSLLRVLAQEARSAGTARALLSANATIANVCQELAR